MWCQIPNECYKILINSSGYLVPLVVTGIKSEVFERKKKLISMCHGTFSNMQEELQEFYSKLEEYENMYENTNHRWLYEVIFYFFFFIL